RPGRPGYAPAAALARRCCHALLGSFKVHNVATVGGNICLSLPAGPMTSFAASLDGVATLIAADGTAREVAVADFVTGDGSNVLAPGELLRKVAIPASSLRGQTSFRQISLSPVGRSAVLVITRRSPDAGAGDRRGAGDIGDGDETVVTVTAATPRPLQLRFGVHPAPDSAVAALDAAGPSYLDDVHGSRLWRESMTRRCVAEAVGELARRTGK
ncbi:MAG: FAD binding domain-containing protein, partial [Trebonia sp.]